MYWYKWVFAMLLLSAGAYAQGSKEVRVVIPQTESLSGSLRNGGEAKALGCTSNTLCVGDDGLYHPEWSFRSFFSFDLSKLPAGLSPANIKSASLEFYIQGTAGNPYEDLKACTAEGCSTLLVEHLHYGNSLEAADFDAGVVKVMKAYGGAGGNPTLKVNAVDVLEAVRRDWENRASLSNHTQYRMRLAKASDGDKQRDLIAIPRLGVNLPPYRGEGLDGHRTPLLVVVYSLP